MHHPEIVFHNHTADERAEGAPAVREHIAAIFRNNPDLNFTTAPLRCGDDFAVCEWTAQRDGRPRVGRRRRLPARGRADRAEGRVLGVASAARAAGLTARLRRSGRL